MPHFETAKPRYCLANPSTLSIGESVFAAPSMRTDTNRWRLMPVVGFAGKIEYLGGAYAHISLAESDYTITRLIPLGREVSLSFGILNPTLARWALFTCRSDMPEGLVEPFRA